MTPTPQLCTFREILTIPGVRRLWMGQLISIAGDFLAIFAVLSIASFRLHGTPAQITGVSIAYMLPLAVFGPLAGVLVDRWADRWAPTRTMVSSDLIRAGLALLLVFVTGFSEIYLILFAISAVSTFFLPAQTVTIRTLVPREGLLAMNATMQQAMLITRIISPALAGALVAKVGPGSCFYLDTVSFLLSALLIGTFNFNLPKRAPQKSQARTVLADLASGIRFILTHPAISFVMIAMASATFAISCFSPLIAIFVRDILQAGTRTFGLISSMTGLGMILGTYCARLLAGRTNSKTRLATLAARLFSNARPGAAQSTPQSIQAGLVSPIRLIVFSLAVIASGILLMGAATFAFVIALGACVMGAGVGLLMAPAQTLIQSETPIPLVGRVSSGVICLISIAQILGLLLSGLLAASVGLRPLFFASAMVLAGLSVAGVWKLNREKVAATPLTELNTVN